MTGAPPLDGIRVLEFAGLAPGPFAGLLLADSGAFVLRIDRAVANAHSSDPAKQPSPTGDQLTRHKTSIAVNLKSKEGIALVKKLCAHADVLIDPFRPGVLERLGLGPDELLALNPALIYGRMTGFRRDGRYKDMAGHDINYLAVSGTLSMLGRAGDRPYPPANVLGDFAGGGATLFQGILLALFSRQRTGKGQVVEANMVDGSSYLTTFPRLGLKTMAWAGPRGTNLLDGGAPYYDTYETKDGKYMAVGALEPQFFRELVKGLGLADCGLQKTRHDPRTWAAMRDTFASTFKSKTRLEWETIFDGTDACVTPVLEYKELETDNDREGDQRPAVTLRDTPSLAISRRPQPRDASQGQGEGVVGEGYKGYGLSPGEGGEQTLKNWLGWKRGRDFEVEDGGLVVSRSPKL